MRSCSRRPRRTTPSCNSSKCCGSTARCGLVRTGAAAHGLLLPPHCTPCRDRRRREGAQRCGDRRERHRGARTDRVQQVARGEDGRPTPQRNSHPLVLVPCHANVDEARCDESALPRTAARARLTAARAPSAPGFCALRKAASRTKVVAERSSGSSRAHTIRAIGTSSRNTRKACASGAAPTTTILSASCASGGGDWESHSPPRWRRCTASSTDSTSQTTGQCGGHMG